MVRATSSWIPNTKNETANQAATTSGATIHQKLFPVPVRYLDPFARPLPSAAVVSPADTREILKP